MEKLGFRRRWIDLIMKCITTLQYSVLLNGQPSNVLTPTRGLRQGGPLSPYLFLLCVEGLGLMLHTAEVEGTVKGVVMCRGGASINHLLLADDCIAFCKSNIQHGELWLKFCTRMKWLLDRNLKCKKPQFILVLIQRGMFKVCYLVVLVQESVVMVKSIWGYLLWLAGRNIKLLNGLRRGFGRE